MTFKKLIYRSPLFIGFGQQYQYVVQQIISLLDAIFYMYF